MAVLHHLIERVVSVQPYYGLSEGDTDDFGTSRLRQGRVSLDQSI